MERRKVLTASVTGTISQQDGKDPEAYKITVVFSDGSKTVLRKTYEEFVNLQGIVYDLLKKKAGYSRKTSRTLVSSLPELNSPLSRILFKDSDLKKMGRMDEFIKELLTLPAVITESETVEKFFGVFLEQKGTSDRAEDEEELKKINKVVEMLSGRDPLRAIPTESPVPSRKMTGYQNAAWTPEGLNERRPQSPGTKTKAFTDEEIMGNSMASPRPKLKKRPISVAVGLADLKEENKDLIANTQETDRSQSPLSSPRSALNEEIMKKRMTMGSPRPGLRHRQFSDSERPQSPLSLSNSSVELNKLRSRSNGDVSPPPENPGDLQSIESEKKESRVRKISTHSGRRSPNKPKYVAVASFAGEETGEVSLEDGEEVEVLQKEASGWWYVKNDFCEGWAPSAFLEPARAQSSRSGSPETLSQAQNEDNLDGFKQKEEEFDAPHEEPIENVDENEDHVEEMQESLTGGSGKTGSQRIPPEMNRRVKFLTVEGIQKRKNPDKNYVYILKVVWSDGTINIVYRQCSDFFFLQENLRKEFPTAIGKEIPVLKGKKFTENCRFCFKDGTCKRRQFMNQFCHELINAPDNISKCQAVMTFCKPRSSDVLPHGQNEKPDDKSKENDEDNVNISGPVVFEQYIVIADYKKKNKNDISLSAGDTVDVIERNNYGWWLVDREGELGWAPASHLEPVDDGSEITTSKTFAPGQEEVYQSIQSHQAQAEDELSFDVGVMLKVVEKNLDGWWLVRYQGEEGWAPAMFLKQVADSDDSSFSTSGKMDELAIVSFNGDSESDDSQGLTRTPPTRRSMVQRSVRKKPKRNSSHQINDIAIQEEEESPETRKKNDRSISVPTKAYTPPPNKKVSPRPKIRSLSRPKSSEVNQGDLVNQWPNRELSMSSGYVSSPSGSLSSLASDVFSAEENTCPTMKKCPTIPRFENVVQEGPFHRSHSASSLVQYKNEMESALNGKPTSSNVKSVSGRSSPIPAPRKSSTASRKSPLAGSPNKNGELKLSPRESSSEIEYESNSDYSQKENEELVYRAVYPYISQEQGEITFNEGDVVEVIRRGENGWWLLKSSKAGLGWGPSNYLESVAY